MYILLQAEIFKNDFEEERKDRQKAQGALANSDKKSYAKIYQEQTAELHKDFHLIRKERKDLKTELARVMAKLKMDRETAREAITHIKTQTETISREKEWYREYYEQMKEKEEELESYKVVCEELRDKIESLNTALGKKRLLEDREISKLKDQVN